MEATKTRMHLPSLRPRYSGRTPSGCPLPAPRLTWYGPGGHPPRRLHGSNRSRDRPSINAGEKLRQLSTTEMR